MGMPPAMMQAMQAMQNKQKQMQAGNTDQDKQALMQRLQGMVDSRGMLGQFSRGNNVYNATAPQAQMGGGPQFGPPVGNQNALAGQQALMGAYGQQQQGGVPGAMGQMQGLGSLRDAYARQTMQGQQAPPQAGGAAPGMPGGTQESRDAMGQLRTAADTAKSVLQAHQMTEAANQQKQGRNQDMIAKALRRRMQMKQSQQAQGIRDQSVRM